jgi:hypothetical protein
MPTSASVRVRYQGLQVRGANRRRPYWRARRCFLARHELDDKHQPIGIGNGGRTSTVALTTLKIAPLAPMQTQCEHGHQRECWRPLERSARLTHIEAMRSTNMRLRESRCSSRIRSMPPKRNRACALPPTVTFPQHGVPFCQFEVCREFDLEFPVAGAIAAAQAIA